MGNLGRYQDFATEAKRAGGVDSLIAMIERNAVERASPKIFGAGALAAAVVAGAAVAVARRYSDVRDVREAQANEAKEQLKAEVEASVNSDATDPENGEDDDDPDAGT